MESLRHLSDEELNAMFEKPSGVELVEKDLESILRADPRGVLPKVGARRAANLLPTLALGGFRASMNRGRRFLIES